MPGEAAPNSAGSPQVQAQPQPATEGDAGFNERERSQPQRYPGYRSGYSHGTHADYYGSGATEDSHADLMAHVRTLYRRRWPALSACAATVLAVVAYTLLATPVFDARAQILIQPENLNVISFQEVLQQEKGTNEYYQTQYAILKSRALAKRTIDKLNLWNDPEFGGVKGPASSFSIGRLIGAAWSFVSGTISPEPSASGEPMIGETAAQARAIDALLGRLNVTPVRNSRLVNITFASLNPRTAAAVANTVAQQYIEQSLEYKFLSTKDAADWLEEQLGEQRKKLEASEQALQAYRERGNAVALEDRQNIVVQRLTDLSTAYTQARTARIEKESLYNQLITLQNNRGALDSFPAVLSNTFIQGLKTQLSDLLRQQAQLGERLGHNHPDMVKLDSAIASTQTRIDGEIGKIVQAVRSEFLAAQSQERGLAAELEAQKDDALALNKTGIEYSVLKREAESNKQIYEALMQRSKETGISGELKTSNIRIVDEAQQPRSPARPRKATNAVLGILAGLMVGVGLAFLLEFVDNRIKNPDEIQQYLALPFLGLVPSLAANEVSGEPLLDSGLPAHFAEAFRGIRTNLVFSSQEAGSRAVLVTSTQPAEGKSVITANLAISLAQTGQRVLLIDGDMRRPRQHEVFGVEQAAGLSGVLGGTVKVSEAVQRTTRKGLWVLPSGAPPQNPSELLGSERFKRLLRTFRENFDWTIIDSPPIMAVTDAAVVAHLTSGVVFVVSCEQTAKPLALRATRQLEAAKATFVGAILNRVNLRRDPYYYSHYYRSEYSNYYSSDSGSGKG